LRVSGAAGAPVGAANPCEIEFCPFVQFGRNLVQQREGGAPSGFVGADAIASCASSSPPVDDNQNEIYGGDPSL